MTAKPSERILVVDDDAAAVDLLAEMLADAGYSVRAETDPRAALKLASAEDFDLVVSDVEMPGMRGIELLRELLHVKASQLVLLVTAFGSIDLAVECVRAGACDFVTKPFRAEVITLAVERALRERQMRTEIVRLRRVLGDTPPEGLLARSAGMRRAVDVARRAAASASPVLLTGESGTGKSMLARFIHDQSSRKTKPFVALNCTALPATLIESELFGVRRGAFTDALEDRAGLFAEADGGTLFLDEIGDLPLEMQPKLLHALEAGTIRSVGARNERTVDVRIVAATNRDLEEALRAQRFRPDLYFRLNVIRIELPALRDRPEDIPPLVDALLTRAAARAGRSSKGITAEAMRHLVTQQWDGNVRELANVMERAVALADHDVLVLDDVRQHDHASPRAAASLAEAARQRRPLEDIEREYVRLVVQECAGNISEASRVLAIDRRTLYKKLEGSEPRPVAAGGTSSPR